MVLKVSPTIKYIIESREIRAGSIYFIANCLQTTVMRGSSGNLATDAVTIATITAAVQATVTMKGGHTGKFQIVKLLDYHSFQKHFSV